MSESVITPQYLQIALDIASRIAEGEFEEGCKIFGRSVLSSEYGVSPETIRRALKLLSDMKVVEIKPKSGVVILSSDSARRYIARFDEKEGARALYAQMKELLAQQTALSRRIGEVTNAIISSPTKFAAAAATPFTNYEIKIGKGSWVAGKSIGELRFWQATGATIIAIRRGPHLILSPGPYAEMFEGDTIVFVGSTAAAEAAGNFIKAE